MSTFIPVEVGCPACGAVQTASLATSLNVTRTPAWREVVLEETFQQLVCRSCASTWEAVEPFVYLDFTIRLYVGVFPVDHEVAWWEHERLPADAFCRNLGWAAPPVARPIGENFCVRTVFGLAALREKIVAREAGMDDAPLEALKLRLMLTGPDPRLDLGFRPRLRSVTPEGLVFRSGAAATSTDGDFYVGRDVYDALRRQPALVDGLLPNLGEGPYVDVGRLLTMRPASAAAHGV